MGHGFDGQHAIVQEENLATAIDFPLHRVPDNALVILGDDRFDGQAIMRRRLNGAHVARASQRQVKRAWDRRGAEGEHIDHLAEHLEFLLVQYPEALLLVDHHEA